MSQRIKVQDNSIIYESVDPLTGGIDFDIRGTARADNALFRHQVIIGDGSLPLAPSQLSVIGNVGINNQLFVGLIDVMGTIGSPGIIVIEGDGSIETPPSNSLTIESGTNGNLELRSGAGANLRIIGNIDTDITLFGSATVKNIPNPIDAGDAANKNYVDAISQGISWKQSVIAATTVNINISSPGTSTFDGVTLTSGDRLLVKNQSISTENGIYTFDTPSLPLVRSSDASTGPELAGASVFVISGSLYQNTEWVQTTLAPIVVGASPIIWTQFGAPVIYSAGTGLSLAGTVFSNAGVLTLSPGSGVSVSSAIGNITVNNTGVLSVTGTANQITASASTGAVILSLPTTITGLTSVTATSFIGNSSSASNIAGGTAGAIPYQIAGNSTGFLSAGTAGNVFISGGTGAPAWTSKIQVPASGPIAISTGINVNGASSVSSTGSVPLTLNTAAGFGAIQTQIGGVSTGIFKWDTATTLMASPDFSKWLYATNANSGAFGNFDILGNLSITGAGRLITGAFGDATPTNRPYIQSSTTNSISILGVMPSGTGNFSAVEVISTNDPGNATVGYIAATGTEVRVVSSARGTGTQLPLSFYTNGISAMSIDPSQNITISGNMTFNSVNTISGIPAPTTSGQVANKAYVDARTATNAINTINIIGGSAGRVVYQSGVGATSFTSVGTSGQLLSSTGTGAPTWVDAPSGASSVSNGVIATGSTQGTATGLTSLINVITGVSGGNSIRLITPVAGVRSTIINVSGSSIRIYPNVGGLIDSVSSVLIDNLTKIDLVSTSTTQWYSLTGTYA